MNNQEAKKILQRDLEIMIENKSLPDGIEAMKVAISALGAIEQFRWERDVAISQLEELGLSLGQRVDDVKEAIEKQESIIAIVHKDTETVICPICHAMAFTGKTWATKGYCFRCGQLLKWQW